MEHEARIIIADGVPPVTCLGDYEAILHTDTLELEAGIGDSTPAQRNIAFSLSAIPGSYSAIVSGLTQPRVW